MPNGNFQRQEFKGENTPPNDPNIKDGDEGTEDKNVNPNNSASPTNERPTWLPDKFETVEDMAKAYGELEKKQSQQNGEKPATQEALKIPQTPEGAENGLPAELQKFSDEFAQNGKLSDESYKILEEQHKIPKAYIDSFIEGQLAVAERIVSQVHAISGGEEEYTKIMKWASVNLSKEEIGAYDKIMTSGSMEQMQLAVSGLKAQYQSKVGNDPNLIHGDGKVAGENSGYGSRAEMVADMKDPRYQNDPAFRKKVEIKISKSQF